MGRLVTTSSPMKDEEDNISWWRGWFTLSWQAALVDLWHINKYWGVERILYILLMHRKGLGWGKCQTSSFVFLGYYSVNCFVSECLGVDREFSSRSWHIQGEGGRKTLKLHPLENLPFSKSWAAHWKPQSVAKVQNPPRWGLRLDNGNAGGAIVRAVWLLQWLFFIAMAFTVGSVVGSS